MEMESASIEERELQEENRWLKAGFQRLGRFGRLFLDYSGCPRGAIGRACCPLEEEVLRMEPITDVDGGVWIPVNRDALMEIVQAYVAMRDKAGWISVKDRLPEKDGAYIVCDLRLGGKPWINTAGFRKASSWCELHGVYYDDRYGRYKEQDKITHWMPMPEPQKEE